MKQIVTGRSGSGKTEYITQKIKEDLKAGYDNIIVIVPDQFTFETERDLIERTGKGLFEIRVLSFRRLITVLRNELGTGGCFELDETNKAMFVNKLLYDYDNELSIYKGTYRTPGFSFDMAKVITECKQFGAAYEDIKSLELKGRIKEKTNDIATILQAYSNFKDKFKDNEDIINIITERISSSSLLKNARIYIDHFDVFTSQGYAVIEEMAKICSCLYVCLCSDNNSKGLFSLTTDTVKNLKNRVPEFEIMHLHSSYCKGSIGHLEKTLFDGEESPLIANEHNVELFSFSNSMAEVDHAVAKIIELKNSGYKYQDICIMTGEPDEYSRLIEQAMLDSNVPYFIDKKLPLISSRISKFAIYALKYCLLFDSSSFIGMLKQNIMLENSEEIFEYENYVLKYGLKKSISPVKDDEYIESLRKQINISSLKNSISKAKTVREMAECMLSFLHSFEITFRDETEERCYDKIVDILERMQLIFEDTEVELSLFTSIFETGIGSVTLGEIPDKRDCVIIGDISRTKIQKARCLLVLGVSDGVIPKLTQKNGLLSDYDTAIINRQKKIGRDSYDLNNLEQLLTYKMFSKPTDYLYLSHSDRGLYGNKRENKILFPKIQKLLGGICVQCNVPFNEDINLRLLNSKAIAYKNLAANVYAGEDNYITRAVYYSYKEENDTLFTPRTFELSITQKQADALYADSVISASRIETYFKCAFMQFVRYGLKPKRRDLFKINKLDTGSLLHSIIEEFSNMLIDKTNEYRSSNQQLDTLYNSLKEKILTGNVVEAIVANRLEADELSVYSEDNIGKAMARRITDMSKGALISIIDDLKDSDFVMTYSEQDLQSLGLGRELVGRIDRIDTSNDGIRVIDYKTSGSKLDYTGIYSGVKLQLLIYMTKIIEYYKSKQNKEMLPLSLEYYRISPEYESFDEVSKFLSFMPSHSVSSLSVGSGKKLLAQEDMSKLIAFGEEKARFARKRIMSGDIAIRPYYVSGTATDNGCQYCEYKSICKNDSMENKRVIHKTQLEDITKDGVE